MSSLLFKNGNEYEYEFPLVEGRCCKEQQRMIKLKRFHRLCCRITSQLLRFSLGSADMESPAVYFGP